MAHDDEGTTQVTTGRRSTDAEITNVHEPQGEVHTDVVPTDEIDRMVRQSQQFTTDEVPAMDDATDTAVAAAPETDDDDEVATAVADAPETDDDDEVATEVADGDDVAQIVASVIARAIANEDNDNDNDNDEMPTSVLPAEPFATSVRQASEPFDKIQLPLPAEEHEQTGLVQVDDIPVNDLSDDDESMELATTERPVSRVADVEYTATVDKQGGGVLTVAVTLLMVALVGATVAYLVLS